MIFEQLNQQLTSLAALLLHLNSQQYNLRIKHLGNASIGAHSRHIIELLRCAVTGYQNGVVDYGNRKRNLELETDIHAAAIQLKLTLSELIQDDKPLQLVNNGTIGTVESTYFREVLYHTEHAIHHLALIKVALIDMDLNLVGENFGMAYSTIKYKESLSQD